MRGAKVLALTAIVAAVLGARPWRGREMGKMVLFSSVRGRVLLADKPVPDAAIEREFRWAWKEESGTDSATTDANGEFALPAIVRSSFLGSFLPHEPMVRQTILIKHSGKTYKAWMFDKGNYRDNGELQGRPIVLTCRLETEPQHHGEVYGICELADAQPALTKREAP
jgi:hypothetical protein